MNNDSLELIDIKSMDEAQLQAYFEQLGEKKFRASQVYQWLHQKLVTDFEQMTNLKDQEEGFLALFRSHAKRTFLALS